MHDYQVLIFSAVLLLLVLLAAFFSCAETALMAVNRYRLRHQAHLRKTAAMRVLKLLKRPDRLLGVILIGSTFANILASSLATLIAFHYFGDRGAILAAILLTFIILIFAEIAPKTLAAIYADQVARFVSYPVQIILGLLYPVVWFANVITNGLLRMLSIKVANYEVSPLSREELRSVVYDTRGKISRQYQHMLLSILDLNKLTVNDIMVPKHDINGIDIDLPLEMMINQIKSNDQDWLPVFHNHINQIVGVLYSRDLLRLLLVSEQVTKENIQVFIEDPYFVPSGTSLYAQLGYFQENHNKIAFVVDEYGDVEGLVTLNDILEEIVGDFTTTTALDKHVIKQPDGSYLVEGTTSVREFNRITEWELPQNGPRTINGLIVEYLEALPHEGTAVLIANYPLEIMRVKENRIKLARVYPRLQAFI